MAAYRKDVSIVFPVSLEPSGWMQDTLPMPKCLAGWLTSAGFSGAGTPGSTPTTRMSSSAKGRQSEESPSRST